MLQEEYTYNNDGNYTYKRYDGVLIQEDNDGNFIVVDQKGHK